MRDEGGQVEIAEQISFARAYCFSNLVCLLRVCSQFLDLGHEDLIAAVGVGVAAGRAKDLCCIVLQ